mmetsp:Transcript_6880/g.10045  ORF Transcript_6880/g.10045 Transcript_6880/m.10045 type:complete len:399 (+) Transcript_6880:225-1421(+)
MRELNLHNIPQSIVSEHIIPFIIGSRQDWHNLSLTCKAFYEDLVAGRDSSYVNLPPWPCDIPIQAGRSLASENYLITIINEGTNPLIKVYSRRSGYKGTLSPASIGEALISEHYLQLCLEESIYKLVSTTIIDTEDLRRTLIEVWSLENNNKICGWDDARCALDTRFSIDGALWAICFNKSICLYRSMDWSLLKTLSRTWGSHEADDVDEIIQICFCSGEILIFSEFLFSDQSSEDDIFGGKLSVFVWNLETGNYVKNKLEGIFDNSLSVSRDGTLLAVQKMSSSGQEIIIYAIETGGTINEQSSFKLYNESLGELQFSGDGSLLVGLFGLDELGLFSSESGVLKPRRRKQLIRSQYSRGHWGCATNVEWIEFSNDSKMIYYAVRSAAQQICIHSIRV